MLLLHDGLRVVLDEWVGGDDGDEDGAASRTECGGSIAESSRSHLVEVTNSTGSGVSIGNGGGGSSSSSSVSQAGGLLERLFSFNRSAPSSEGNTHSTAVMTPLHDARVNGSSCPVPMNSSSGTCSSVSDSTFSTAVPVLDATADSTNRARGAVAAEDNGALFVRFQTLQPGVHVPDVFEGRRQSRGVGSAAWDSDIAAAVDTFQKIL